MQSRDNGLRLVNQLHAEEMRQAAMVRRIPRPTRSVRRAIGASIVRFGTRLAGAPPYELARTR